jgi:hypothetical protein
VGGCVAGVLVRTVTQISYDIRYFLVILAVLIIGFSNAFYMMARTDLRGVDTAKVELNTPFNPEQIEGTRTPARVSIGGSEAMQTPSVAPYCRCPILGTAGLRGGRVGPGVRL